MRDVKFRGKRKDTDEWAYGYYVEIEGKSFIIDKYANLRYHECPDGIHGIREVNPETIGQYTGLKDKNGKEGYFNDIIKDDNGHIGVIKWDEKKLRVYFEWDDKQITYPLEHYDYIDFVIIGNQTDAPELLEQK